jgi:hypothetical protein
MNQNDVVEFAIKFYKDIKRNDSRIAGISKREITEDYIPVYVANYFKHKKKPYIDRLTKLINRWRDAVHIHTGVGLRFYTIEQEIDRWTGYDLELIEQIKRLEKQNKAKKKKNV